VFVIINKGGIIKKFTALVLVFSLMMLSVNLYAKERRGAKLIVTKLDGQRIEGELITVKPNSLLLLDTEGKDVSVDVVDIEIIRIVKKSKAGVGFLLGGGLGALSGLVPEARSFFSQGERVIIGAIFFSLIGTLLGALAGADGTIQLLGMTDSEIQETLDYLRKKARVRNYK
jgi:hypothetical protein